MTVIETTLNNRERQILSFCRSVTFVTAHDLSAEIGINYYTSLKYLHSLTAKGYLNSVKKGNTWNFYLPRMEASQSMTIPYKGRQYTLEELLLYLSENSDFQKYGKVISSACYHLAYRVAQIQAGETPDTPGPKEVAEFLRHAKLRYQELLNLVSLIEGLPIFDDNELTIAAFGEINEKYLHEQVFSVFQPTWKSGKIGKHGMVDKFRDTLTELKTKFVEKYGISRKVAP